MTRPELLNQAVVEAARTFMAQHLRHEDARDVPRFEVDEALQELRDALAAQSKARVRR